MPRRPAASEASLVSAPASSAGASDALIELLGRARLQVLRATALIGLLIALSNLFGAIAGFSVSGEVHGPATELAVAWCALWALAMAFPAVAARCLASWRITALALTAANALTVALSGGIESPLLAVCMYVGWIASVVVAARPALTTSLMITGSVFAGYVLAGDSTADVLSGPYRYGAVTNALLPLLTGLVGVLLGAVTSAILSRLDEILAGLRAGAAATTTTMTNLFAGRRLLAAPSATSARPALTEAERAVVALLAEGHRPKQIARLRGGSLSTVRSHIKAAKRKCGARTIDGLVSFGWEEPA